jgi:hypothetical protein
MSREPVELTNAILTRKIKIDVYNIGLRPIASDSLPYNGDKLAAERRYALEGYGQLGTNLNAIV